MPSVRQQASCPQVIRGQPVTSLLEKNREGRLYVFRPADGFGKGLAEPQGRRQVTELDGLVFNAQGLLEAKERFRPEPPGERSRRHAEQITDPPDAETVQPLADVGGKAQGRHRQRTEGLPLGSRHHAADATPAVPVLPGVFPETGHGPGRAGRRGSGQNRFVTEPPKPFAEVGKQVLLTPEQVHAAGNIQPKPGPASPIKGGQRRVEGAPIGERLEGLGIGGRIGITNRKVGHQGTSIGQRQSGNNAGRFRRLVGTGDAHGGNGGERPRVPLFVLKRRGRRLPGALHGQPPDAVRGEPRKPERNHPPPVLRHFHLQASPAIRPSKSRSGRFGIESIPTAIAVDRAAEPFPRATAG